MFDISPIIDLISLNYTVKIAEFEGPFDLVLYFIERDELNIYDIPIAKIADDFLAYINDMSELNIELASEFMLVAATLMKIKARMLLPRKDLNEQGEEIDPRDELVARLIEYKKYKAVVKDLELLELERLQRYQRGNIKGDVKNIANNFSTEMDLESINLFKLLQVFNKVVNRVHEKKPEVRHNVIQYPYTIHQQKSLVTSRVITNGKEMYFTSIFEDCETKIEAIFRFLAILELINERTLSITIGEGANNFWLKTISEQNAKQEPQPES